MFLRNKNLIIPAMAMVLSLGCAGVKPVAPPPPPAPAPSEGEMKVLNALGGELTPENNIKLGDVLIDRQRRELSFPAEINMWEHDIEVLVCTKKGRAHESLLITEVDPFTLQLALILFGASNGSASPAAGEARGEEFKIEVLPDGENERRSIDGWLFNNTKGAVKKDESWVFVGSSFKYGGVCLASEDGNLININSMDKNTILNADGGSLPDYYTVMTDNLPPKRLRPRPGGGQIRDPFPVTVFLRPIEDKPPESKDER